MANNYVNFDSSTDRLISANITPHTNNGQITFSAWLRPETGANNDFVQLTNRGLPAPYVPYIASPTDTRHSPDEEDLEIPDSVTLDPSEVKKTASFFPEFQILGGSIEHDWNPDEPVTRARRKSEI